MEMELASKFEEGKLGKEGREREREKRRRRKGLKDGLNWTGKRRRERERKTRCYVAVKVAETNSRADGDWLANWIGSLETEGPTFCCCLLDTESSIFLLLPLADVSTCLTGLR